MVTIALFDCIVDDEPSELHAFATDDDATEFLLGLPEGAAFAFVTI